MSLTLENNFMFSASMSTGSAKQIRSYHSFHLAQQFRSPLDPQICNWVVEKHWQIEHFQHPTLPREDTGRTAAGISLSVQSQVSWNKQQFLRCRRWRYLRCMAARPQLDLLIFQVSLACALSLGLRLLAIFLDETKQ